MKKISNSGQDDDEVDDEIDELASSRDVTPPPVITDRSPVKCRLKPRQTQTHTPPDGSDDGDDDEEEEIEDEGATEDAVSVDVAEEDGDNAGATQKKRMTQRSRSRGNSAMGRLLAKKRVLKLLMSKKVAKILHKKKFLLMKRLTLDLEAEDDESEESSHDEFTEEVMDDGEQSTFSMIFFDRVSSRPHHRNGKEYRTPAPG